MFQYYSEISIQMDETSTSSLQFTEVMPESRLLRFGLDLYLRCAMFSDAVRV